MTPEAQLCDTVNVTLSRFGLCVTDPPFDPWVVVGGVLMAQQAAVIALRAAGDTIPAQAGGTELLLRAASKDRLPAPFTLPFGSKARHDFDRLVEARNAFMHPRGVTWFVSAETLSRGMPVATGVVRHLILTQPILEGLVSPAEQAELEKSLQSIDAFANFLEDPY
ncbi:MAG: hypothetical protein HRT82_04690 [Henriciella sp.]|nr:hypothetical protein [Henriciella sp.]